MSAPDQPAPLEPFDMRALACGVARVTVSFSLLVIAYFVVPLDWLATLPALLTLPIALALFGVLLLHEVRSIVGASYPGIRALEALGVLVPLFLLIFASTYYVMGAKDESWFSEHLSRLDALYFTLTTFATVGYGDITAVGPETRTVVSVQMFLDIIVLGAGIKVILGAVRRGRQIDHRTSEEPDG